MSLDVQSQLILPGSEPTRGIVFEYNGKTKKVFGGSFFHAPESDKYITINLMAEHASLPSDISFPIPDFSQPQTNEPLRHVFEEILNSDKDVYVGCFGGKGRTGLFMAALLKYVGVKNPIEEVRAQYRPEAVETWEQAQYVQNFPSLFGASVVLPPRASSDLGESDASPSKMKL